MNRDDSLRQLEDHGTVWDIIVIGGGATGLGAAVDAASRGYRTLLLEQHDFAKGTSSRSTKLIHGGVRYLRQGNISLVLEGLRERALLLRNAPHLVHGRTFVVPSHSPWQSAMYGAGLKLYDVLAGRQTLPKSRILTRHQALAHIPNLAQKGLRGGILYSDGQFDDARLAVSLAQTLADFGGSPINYVKVSALLKSSGRICGLTAVDAETGQEYEIRGRAVINATGAFSEQVVKMDEAIAPRLLTLSQGIHLVFDRAFLGGDSALMVPQTDDGRVLFAIPWLGKVVVGTTDTPAAEPSLEPHALEAEIDFVLEHAARYLAHPPTRSDITGIFTGLRPLLHSDSSRGTAAISRDYAVKLSPSGLVTIAGGKWTIYRKMGEEGVTRAAAAAGLPQRPSPTRTTRIHGYAECSEPNSPLGAYGSDAPSIRELITACPMLGERVHCSLPYVNAQVVWAARYEMARSIEDVLARRTRALVLDARASIEAAPGVAELMAAELGRGADWCQTQVREYSSLAREYLPN